MVGGNCVGVNSGRQGVSRLVGEVAEDNDRHGRPSQHCEQNPAWEALPLLARRMAMSASLVAMAVAGVPFRRATVWRST